MNTNKHNADCVCGLQSYVEANAQLGQDRHQLLNGPAVNNLVAGQRLDLLGHRLVWRHIWPVAARHMKNSKSKHTHNNSKPTSLLRVSVRTVCQLQVLHREVHNGWVLLHEPIVLGEALQGTHIRSTRIA